MMKSLAEFEAYFNETIAARGQKYLSRYWAIVRDFWWPIGLAIVVPLTIMIVGINRYGAAEKGSGWIEFLITIVGFFGLAVAPLFMIVSRGDVAVKRARALSKEIKKEITIPAVLFLLPDFTYAPERHVDLEKVRGCRVLDPDAIVRENFTGEDYFFGKVGETHLEFCEFNWDILDSRNEHYTIQGKGRCVFCVADFHKPLQGVTLVQSSTSAIDFEMKAPQWAKQTADGVAGVLGAVGSVGKFLGALSSAINPAKNIADEGELRSIKLEDPMFDRAFSVKCTDDVEAHYILTPSFMKRLFEFVKNAHASVSLAFHGGKLYLRLTPVQRPNQKKLPILFYESERVGNEVNPFDLDLFVKPNVFSSYKKIYDELALVIGTVEALNLNQNLWGGYLKEKYETK